MEYHTITLQDLTLQDFILLVLNHSKSKKCSPLISLNSLLEYIKELKPQDLQTAPINICDIDYTIKNHYKPKKERKKENEKRKCKANSTNKKYIHTRGTGPKETKRTKPRTDRKTLQSAK